MADQTRRIAVGSDERTWLTDSVVDSLRKRGFDPELHGALADEDARWPVVARRVAQQVADGTCAQGLLFCWTGTGVAMAANKVAGIRAALCCDAETARGARRWNDANILCISLRQTSPAIAQEMLDAWLTASPDESELPNIDLVKAMDRAARV